MIVAGYDNNFSIAAEVTEITDNWILGRFRFVLHGKVCGNWDDAADLRGCHGWLKDFSIHFLPRFEHGLLTLPEVEIFERLVKPVLVQPDAEEYAEVYPDTLSRFHISHLGMSSFNAVTMVLVEGAEQQRCVWQANNDPIMSDLFPQNCMQNVAQEFCDLFQKEVAAHGHVL
ncbi:MAG: hypothetical protein B7Z47_06985 [Chthoniobacter sp. 12-60-6]|nr:MAG: hypothetical protein B7Z47_06985 [Chthoniobacter sp. 12-60-6]